MSELSQKIFSSHQGNAQRADCTKGAEDGHTGAKREREEACCLARKAWCPCHRPACALGRPSAREHWRPSNDRSQAWAPEQRWPASMGARATSDPKQGQRAIACLGASGCGAHGLGARRRSEAWAPKPRAPASNTGALPRLGEPQRCRSEYPKPTSRRGSCLLERPWPRQATCARQQGQRASVACYAAHGCHGHGLGMRVGLPKGGTGHGHGCCAHWASIGARGGRPWPSSLA